MLALGGKSSNIVNIRLLLAYCSKKLLTINEPPPLFNYVRILFFFFSGFIKRGGCFQLRTHSYFALKTASAFNEATKKEKS